MPWRLGEIYPMIPAAHSWLPLSLATLIFVTASKQFDVPPNGVAADDDAGIEQDRDSLLREIHDELIRANERLTAAKRRLELEVTGLSVYFRCASLAVPPIPVCQERVLVDADANLEKNPQRGPLAEIALPRLGQLVSDRCARPLVGLISRTSVARC
jgi:hypothetical protein